MIAIPTQRFDVNKFCHSKHNNFLEKKKWVWACLWILYSLTLHVFLFNTGGIAGGIFSSSSRDDFNNVTVSLICPSVEEGGLELSSEAGTSKHIIIF